MNIAVFGGIRWFMKAFSILLEKEEISFLLDFKNEFNLQLYFWPTPFLRISNPTVGALQYIFADHNDGTFSTHDQYLYT